MRVLFPVIALLGGLICPVTAVCAQGEGEGRAAGLARELAASGLDPQACYRVRELNLAREDLRLYFTEGHLIFGKPVAGRRISALFIANVDGGDAELLVMPPSRGERASLAKFTRTPNLNEHFHSALMIFTDDTAELLLGEIKARGEPRLAPEMGHALAAEWNSVLSNLQGSFQIHLVHNLLSQVAAEDGFFYAALGGRKLGNFDILYDPDLIEQIFIGQMAYREDKAYYDIWANFPARSFRNGKRRVKGAPIEVSSYRIEARLDPDLRLTAVTEATVTPQQAPVAVLAFDLSAGMHVKSVRVNGEAAEVYTRESLRSDLIRRNASSSFLVIPARALEPGRHYAVEFEHEGNVVSTAGKQVFYVGGRGNWYPQAGWNFALYDITFTYPAGLQLVFPGELRQDSTEGEWRTTRRRTSNPIRLAGFNLGDYEQVRIRKEGLTVEVFANREVEEELRPRDRQIVMLPNPPSWTRGRSSAPSSVMVMPAPEAPPDPTARLRTLAEEVASAFAFFAGHFGAPTLPLLMVSPVPGTFGQGFPGLVYLSTISYLNPGERPKGARNQQLDTFFSELLHAHETAHQWWGNVVTSRSHRDDWLMEALANYSALMVLERKKDARALREVLEQYRLHLLAKDASGNALDAAGPIHWGSRLHNSQSPDAWRAIVYEKGSWIIHMLRARLGDENFLKLLGETCRRYRMQTITTEQFFDLAASFMPPGSKDAKLEAFREQWVESTGIPTIRLGHALIGKAPRLRVRLKLSMTDAEEGATLMVPVEFQYRGRKPEMHWVKAEAGESQVDIAVRQAPDRVLLDPQRSVLATYP